MIASQSPPPPSMPVSNGAVFLASAQTVPLKVPINPPVTIKAPASPSNAASSKASTNASNQSSNADPIQAPINQSSNAASINIQPNRPHVAPIGSSFVPFNAGPRSRLLAQMPDTSVSVDEFMRFNCIHFYLRVGPEEMQRLMNQNRIYTMYGEFFLRDAE